MTAAVLGVLKAGAAFVPIDADYPAQRIAYMLEDCGAEVLLMQKAHCTIFIYRSCPVHRRCGRRRSSRDSASCEANGSRLYDLHVWDDRTAEGCHG